jgi:DNA-directed RNA polymerase specialized sigma24 family protein
MGEDGSFRELIRRVRARDDQAAADLVRWFAGPLHLVVRHRLTDPALRRRLDTADVCQTVLASFFERAAQGRFLLDRPEDLRRLLATMARHEVTNQRRKQGAGRRDRVEAPGDGEPAAPGSDPSDIVADRELLGESWRRLSAEERQLAELRADGRSWAEVAAAVGGNADALRMQLARALRRVAAELGLEFAGA